MVDDFQMASKTAWRSLHRSGVKTSTPTKAGNAESSLVLICRVWGPALSVFLKVRVARKGVSAPFMQLMSMKCVLRIGPHPDMENDHGTGAVSLLLRDTFKHYTQGGIQLTKFHASRDGSTMRLHEHLYLTRSRRQLVCKPGILTLNLLQRQIFGEGRRIEAQLGGPVRLADVRKLVLGRLRLILVYGAISRGGGKGGKTRIDAVVEDSG